MTVQGPTPEPPSYRPDPQSPPSAGLGPVPEWLRHPHPEVAPSHGDRWRIWLSRHSVPLLAGAVAVLTLAFCGLVVAAGGWVLPNAERPVAHPTVSRPVGEQASTSASPPPSAGPFDGTPAATFPEGEAGIALPAAKRTGAFSEKQVTAALAKVRGALVTARLDRRFMTARAVPEQFVRRFAPDARAGIRKDFTTGDAGSYATRLAPGARITPDPVRVKGRISYRATKDADGIRILAVTTNFVWAYAFTSSTVPGAGVVVVHDTVVWSVPHPDDVTAASNGLWIEKSQSYASNIDCAAFDKGLLGLGSPSYGGPDDPDPDAVFDPDKTLDLPDTC